jgi:hypothetical protein
MDTHGLHADCADYIKCAHELKMMYVIFFMLIANLILIFQILQLKNIEKVYSKDISNTEKSIVRVKGHNLNECKCYSLFLTYDGGALFIPISYLDGHDFHRDLRDDRIDSIVMNGMYFMIEGYNRYRDESGVTVIKVNVVGDVEDANMSSSLVILMGFKVGDIGSKKSGLIEAEATEN